VGLAVAAELAVAHREEEWKRLERLRDELERAIVEQIPDAVIHGRGVACSGGSACQSGSVGTSHVLTAIGARPELATVAIRMSFGVLSDDECVRRVAEVFPKLAAKARAMAEAR
jgi:cysteine desulfurase